MPAILDRRSMLATPLLIAGAAAYSLSSRCDAVKMAPGALHDFLATPANWPKIVLSSWSVEGDTIASPLPVGSEVTEVFGAPPVLPLRVTWTCATSDRSAGTLTFKSPDGVPGIASECEMDFSITPEAAGTSSVELTMSFEPASPLVLAAVPLLAADNALALNILLPRAVAPSALGT